MKASILKPFAKELVSSTRGDSIKSIITKVIMDGVSIIPETVLEFQTTR